MTALSLAAPRPAGRVRALTRHNEAGLVGIVVVIGVIAALALPSFRTSGNLSQILNNSGLVVIVAVGQAIVILARQIDLSVGAILGLGAFLIGSAVGHLGGLGIPLGVLMALGLGALLGLGNGLLIVTVRMPAIIATLATLSIYGGLQVVVTGGSQLYASKLPDWLAAIPSTSWLGVSPLVWVALVCVVIVGFIARMTRWGRDIYAMGSNPEAAEYIGVRSHRRTCEAFMLSGALAGLGGLLYAGRYGNVDATAGAGFELTVIAAAVIGGVSLFGGSGTPAGAALGALLLVEIENILALLKISIFAEQTLEGAAIVLSVAIYSIVSRRLRRPIRPGRAAEEEQTAEAVPA